MPPSSLIVRTCRYSVDPWRLGVLSPAGVFQELPHATFARKRDALLLLTALQALPVDWSQPPDTWPADARAAAWAVLTQTDAYAAWLALVQQPRAPGEGGHLTA